MRLAKAVALSPSSMEAIEAAAEEADGDAAAFVQVQAHRRGLRGTARGPQDARQAILDLLTSQGKSMKSTLLMSLASKIAADPFAKIKVLIQELIERLLQEAANEAAPETIPRLHGSSYLFIFICVRAFVCMCLWVKVRLQVSPSMRVSLECSVVVSLLRIA